MTITYQHRLYVVTSPAELEQFLAAVRPVPVKASLERVPTPQAVLRAQILARRGAR